ncbi:hypothetical protein ACFQBQ_01315 [Granulicella cerasi]|uniref:Uncharacterized protein n=1 Tax=Granulicella cerasi TaxID=741063 RepID=A0ABW1Z3X4_9BACT|nr:hypothetical protein [Granulicella cerasi]
MASLLDRLIKLCDEQKHDPKLTIIIFSFLPLSFVIDLAHHWRSIGWEFWKPALLLAFILFASLSAVWREMRWMKAQHEDKAALPS